MKMSLILSLCLLMSAGLAKAAAAEPPMPKFEDYEVHEHFAAKAAKPRIKSRQDRLFRTQIRRAAKEKPNFAGHYIVWEFGCGASCVMGFTLDAKTGQVAWIPFTVCCWDFNEPADFEPLTYQLGSRLMVAKGSRNEQGNGVYYYAFQNGKFELLREVEKPAEQQSP